MAAEGGLQSPDVVLSGAPAPAGAAAAPAARAATFGTQLAELEEMLRESPGAFEFFQAVRTLERLRPDRAGPGQFVDPSREVVRFSATPSLGFPPSEVQSLDMSGNGPARMTVNFFGLTGPLGVLPYEYTLLIAERLRSRDSAMNAFFNLFNHRLISLFYRAWERNRFTVGYEKGTGDRLGEHLLDLVGQGMDVERRRVVAREALPFYAGLLGPQPRSAVALQQMLEDMFEVGVEVEQFVGGWYPLSQRDQCAIGEEAGPSGQLGLGAVAGDEIWDQQTKVRLRLGPMSRSRYIDFLPNGSAHALLRWIVRFFSRDAFDFEVQLVMARDDVPGCVLGDDDSSPQPLGWSTWIRTETFPRDADDTVVRL